jgi:hypothetical protein
MPRRGAATLLTVLLVAGCSSSTPSSSAMASHSTPTATTSVPSSAAPTAGPTVTVTSAPSMASEPSAPPVRLASARLPVRGSGRDLGTQIQMAPGPGGRLWITIPGERGVLVALLDLAGQASRGWPVLLPDVHGCDSLLPVADESVRIVCRAPSADGATFDAIARAFSFDADGGSAPGWPVDIVDGSIGAMADMDLIVLKDSLLHTGGEVGQQWPVAVVAVSPDGKQRTGVEVPFACCDGARFVGPDAIAYGLSRRDWESPSTIKTDVWAFGIDGVRPGWPITIDGNASNLAFDAGGRIYTVVADTARPDTSRTIVLDDDGQRQPAGSGALPIVSSATWSGAGDESPGPPVVAGDGSAFIVDTRGDGTNIQGLSPSGETLAGWPYRSELEIEWTGSCGEEDTGCGFTRTSPAVDSNGTLYLLSAASSRAAGGSIVAIDHDGAVRDGWPVGLRRAGAMFWSMAVGPDNMMWALAVEPEQDGHSATVLAIADDSTVLWSTTVVEP